MPSAQVVIDRETPDIASSTDDYAHRFAGSVGEFFLTTQKNAVLQMLSGHRCCSVLDVGGGHAQLAAPLTQQGHHVHVVGSDDTCKRQLLQNKIECEFTSGDLLDLPFPDTSFDVVVSFRILPHLNNWQRLISECCRVASKVVVVDYPDLRSVNAFSSWLFGAKQQLERNTRPFRCFRRAEVIGELRRNGFGECQLKPQFFFPMVLHRMIRSGVAANAIENLARAVGLTGRLGSPMIVRALAESEF